MKILLLSFYFPPYNTIASLRTYSFAKYLSKAGYDVTILTLDFGANKNDLKYDLSNFKLIKLNFKWYNKIFKIFKNQATNNLDHIHINNSYLIKIFNNFKKFFIKFIKCLRSKGYFCEMRSPTFSDLYIVPSIIKILKLNEKFDVIISSGGPFNQHLIGLVLKLLKRGKVLILDYRDLWTQNHIFKGVFPFTFMDELLEYLINKNSDYIITVSKQLAQQIENKYKLNKIYVIENGFDKDDLVTLDAGKVFSDDDKIKLVYTGTVYPKFQDPTPLFEAINKIMNEYDNRYLLDRLEVIFVGSSADILQPIINKYNVGNYIKILPKVDRLTSLKMQRDADILIFLEYEGVDGILTGKLFEYLYSNTLIWGIGVSEKNETGKIIIESGNGILMGKNVELIKSELLKYLRYGMKPMVNTNRNFIEYYSRENLSNKLIELLRVVKNV
jgi:glycosyltransferase involved in cell wall biosynthesis